MASSHLFSKEVFSDLGEYVRSTFESFLRYRECVAAQNELESLDDRLLSDLGIHRSDIPHAVWGESVSSSLDRKNSSHFS